MAAYLCAGMFPNQWAFRDRLIAVGGLIEGRGNLGDFAQDMVGFRRLWEGRDIYPVLGPALREIGIHWDLHIASTHPPTAFLFAAPIAFLSPSAAGRLWVAAGFALVFFSLTCYGVRWKSALGLSLLSGVLWAPITVSFAQLTLVWLAGLALAYRFRFRHPLLAGMGVGIASLTKLLPLCVVGYFLFLRKFRAAMGALLVWAVAAALVLSLEPRAFSRYAEANRENSFTMMAVTYNISVFAQSYIKLGRFGLAAAIAYVACLILRNRKTLFAPASSPEYSFFLYSFFAVLLLPIAWCHSLAPLLPVLGYFVLFGRGLHVLLAGGCFLMLVLLRPFGPTFFLSLIVPLLSLLFWLQPPEDGRYVTPADSGKSTITRPMARLERYMLAPLSFALPVLAVIYFFQPAWLVGPFLLIVWFCIASIRHSIHTDNTLLANLAPWGPAEEENIKPDSEISSDDMNALAGWSGLTTCLCGITVAVLSFHYGRRWFPAILTGLASTLVVLAYSIVILPKGMRFAVLRGPHDPRIPATACRIAKRGVGIGLDVFRTIASDW